jgi:methionyl-tRNA synthetase
VFVLPSIRAVYDRSNAAKTNTPFSLFAAEAVRIAAVLLSPVLPECSSKVLRRLGWQALAASPASLTWGALFPRSPVAPGEPLFPRIEF